VARQANRDVIVDKIAGDIADDSVAQRFADCDFLFLAANSMRACLVFNALVHQYIIPGAQIGAKVAVDRETGEILDVFSVYRPVFARHRLPLVQRPHFTSPASRRGPHRDRAPRAALCRGERDPRPQRCHPQRHCQRPRR
jgi:hypothetical protein